MYAIALQGAQHQTTGASHRNGFLTASSGPKRVYVPYEQGAAVTPLPSNLFRHEQYQVQRASTPGYCQAGTDDMPQ